MFQRVTEGFFICRYVIVHAVFTCKVRNSSPSLSRPLPSCPSSPLPPAPPPPSLLPLLLPPSCPSPCSLLPLPFHSTLSHPLPSCHSPFPTFPPSSAPPPLLPALQGFKYLYLTSADLRKVNIGNNCYVKTELIDDEGESRYKIIDIIGKGLSLMLLGTVM